MRFPLTYFDTEPYVIPKQSLTGSNTERVDTRVLQVLYALPQHTSIPLYIGQQMDVYIEATKQPEGIVFDVDPMTVKKPFEDGNSRIESAKACAMNSASFARQGPAPGFGAACGFTGGGTGKLDPGGLAMGPAGPYIEPGAGLNGKTSGTTLGGYGLGGEIGSCARW